MIFPTNYSRQAEKLRDSASWCAHFNVVVLDPDGWNRANVAASWNEQITQAEFANRISYSTVQLSPQYLAEMARYDQQEQP